jgi:hypothetical protein
MIKKAIMITVLSLTLLGISAFCAQPSFVRAAATTPEEACKSLSAADRRNNPFCNGIVAPTENPVAKTIRNVSGLMALSGGVVAVFYVILGGFYYVTSSGDAQKAANARNTILYALIGLVIIIFAESIILFVLSRVT